MHRNLSLLFLFIFTVESSADNPIVNTKFGPVVGKWLKTNWNLPVAAYLGIPYAEPPVGSLRFKNPRPWDRYWIKVRDATEDGSCCVQVNKDNDVVGNEDCLSLNIFVPEIINDEKLPVLVYVHGGAFFMGSNNSTLLSPSYLLNQKIILVTPNYRLGIFGFLSSGNQASPGNYGLKDVVQALKWIQENIEVFGGDPSSVTLYGHSAGASLAHHLALSKRTEGLFDKLITQSGSANAPWGIHSSYTAKIRYIALAIQLGCSTDRKIIDLDSSLDEHEDYESIVEDDMQILDCLREKSPRSIAEKLSFFHVWYNRPYCNFGPTIEPQSEDAIVTRHPMSVIEDGEFRDIPWIAGVTADEGLVNTVDLIENPDEFGDLIDEFEEIAALFFESDEIIESNTVYGEKLLEFYLPNRFNTSSITWKHNITEMASDALIIYWTYEALNAQTPLMNSSTFFYQFAYSGTFSTTFNHHIPERFGVAHGDDLNFIFPIINTQLADLQLRNTADDEAMINIMTEMWYNFVKNGIPSARLTPDWAPYREDFRFMMLGMGKSPDISMTKNILPIRMEFWNDLIANVSVPRENLFPDTHIEEAFLDLLSAHDDNISNGNIAQINVFTFRMLPLLLIIQLII